MEKGDLLLNHDRLTAENDKTDKKDLIKECDFFLRAEDGSGDGNRMPLYNASLSSGSKETTPVTSTPNKKRESPTEQISDSNPECDIEDVPDLPLDEGLPSTVTVLDGPNGGKVYLVGTSHFSVQSQEDVAKVIQEVRPHIVMVELCSQRTNVLLMEEQALLKEVENINIKRIRELISQNGVFNGLMHLVFLNMSAHITKELGMAPGGEFRRAMAEAKRIPNCIVHLGDRSINITLHRAISALSWKQTFKFVWYLLTNDEKISPEDVEKCKQKKMLDEMLEEMSEDFPALKQTFVVERDMYLCHSLQVAALMPLQEPCRVVGVVGMGHIKGIVELWGKVNASDITPLLVVPPPSVSTRVLRVSVRVFCVATVIYAGYKLFPRRWLP